MRKTHFACLLIACLGYAIYEAAGQSNVLANLTPQLVLTTEVVEAKFCDSDHLRLQLRLRYVNESDLPVILYRRSNTIVTYFISKTVEDAEVQKYDQKYSPMQRAVAPSELVDSTTPGEGTFVILKSGATYEVLTQADFPFIYDGKNEDSDLLRPGRHILRVRVQTWLESQDRATSFRERWSTHGYLWTQSIVSQPMTFDIPRHPEIIKCTPY